jgi:hypothetical protein
VAAALSAEAVFSFFMLSATCMSALFVLPAVLFVVFAGFFFARMGTLPDAMATFCATPGDVLPRFLSAALEAFFGLAPIASA